MNLQWIDTMSSTMKFWWLGLLALFVIGLVGTISDALTPRPISDADLDCLLRYQYMIEHGVLTRAEALTRCHAGK